MLRKKNFECTSSDEHVAIEENFALKEDPQPRGRARGHVDLQRHAGNQQSPSPQQNQPAPSLHSRNVPYQSRSKENAEGPLPLLPKIHDNHQQQDRPSPSSEYRQVEPLPAHHDTRRGDERYSRSTPVYIVDSRRFYDQHGPRRSEQDHMRRDEGLTPNININIHNGKEYNVEEPAKSSGRHHRCEGNRPQDTRRVKKHHSFEAREFSRSSSSRTPSVDTHRASSSRSLSRTEQNVDRREPEVERKSRKDHAAKEQSRDHPRKDHHSSGLRNSRLSQSAFEHSTEERLAALRDSPLDAENIFDGRAAQRISSRRRASKSSSRTPSHRDGYSDGHNSPASSGSDNTQRRRRQPRRPPPPPSPAEFRSSWDNLGHGYSVPKGDTERFINDLWGNQHQKGYRDHNGPLHERLSDVHHTHGEDRKQPAPPKPTSSAADGYVAWDGPAGKYSKQASFVEDLIGNHAANQLNAKGEDCSASSQHDDSRRRRRHERRSHAVGLDYSNDEARSRPEKGDLEAATKRQSATQQKKHSHGWAETQGQDSEVQGDPATNHSNPVLSVADAAKYYQDDWGNGEAETANKFKSKEREYWDTPDLSTPTEVSFLAADAAKYYRDDWAKEEPLRGRTPTGKVEEDKDEDADANVSHRRIPVSLPGVTCSEISPIFKTPISDAFLEVPSPPFDHDYLDPDMGSRSAVQSPHYDPQLRRRILSASYKGKEVRPPSTIVEGSEGVETSSRINGVVEEASTELVRVRRPCSQERRDENLRQLYYSDSESGRGSDEDGGTVEMVE